MVSAPSHLQPAPDSRPPHHLPASRLARGDFDAAIAFRRDAFGYDGIFEEA